MSDEKGKLAVAIQIVILVLLLGVIPLFVGGIPGHMNDGKETFDLPKRWVSGQFLLWAGFQLICVPLVLRKRDFMIVVILYSIYIFALVLLTVAMGIRRRAKKMSFHLIRGFDSNEKTVSLLWVPFVGLLLFQLVQAVQMTYADGDDAFYVAVSTITTDAETMYQKLPYTGGGTLLDARHGMAPFPIWIAFLAKLSGVPAVTVAHVVLPLVLISMTYAVFYLLGCRLFPEKDGKLPLFLIFTELLVLFGDYSYYTVENFMIARSRQGKAALGSIVIPFILYLLLVMVQKLQEKERIPSSLYLLLAAGAVTGCLCSTLGALLLCMLIGVTGLVAAICYRERRILLPMMLCCMPCVCYALLYLVL